MPCVRVVIPTYNRALLLNEAIRSVLSQTFQDIELIIVDDGSIDNTREIVCKFEKNDSRVRYLKKINGGVSSARNTGIRHPGKFKYVAFLDSDDLWLPHHIEESIKIFEDEPEITVLFSRVKTLDHVNHWNNNSLQLREKRMRWAVDNASRISSGCAYIIDPEISFQGLLENNINPHPSTVVINAASVGNGEWFDEELAIFEDLDFFFRLGLRRLVFAFLDSIHCHARYHGDNLTGFRDISSPIFLKRNQAVLKYYRRKREQCVIDKDKKFVSQQIASQTYLLGQSFMEQSGRIEARHLYSESFRLSPSYRALKGFAITLLPEKFYLCVRRLKKEGKYIYNFLGTKIFVTKNP